MTENIIIKDLEYYQQKYNTLLETKGKIEKEYYKERAKKIATIEAELSNKYNLAKTQEEVDYALEDLNNFKVQEAIEDPINPVGTLLYRYNITYDYTGPYPSSYNKRTYTLITPNIIGMVKVMTPELNKNKFYSKLYLKLYLNMGTKFIHVFRKNSLTKFTKTYYTNFDCWFPKDHNFDDK